MLTATPSALCPAGLIRPLPRAERWILFGLLAFAFALRFVPALLLPNLLWPDEIFQTLEQGHRLAFGYGIVPWEYVEGLRNWVVPGVIGIVMWLTQWMGPGSTGYLAAVAAVLCAISLLPVYVAFRWSFATFGRWPAIAAAVVVAGWFELIYFAPKAFFGAIAASILVYAMYRGSVARARADAGAGTESDLSVRSNPLRNPWIVFGLLAGLAFALRLQLVLAVAALFFIYCRRDIRDAWIPSLLGAAAVVVVSGLVDWITWSYPFQSFWVAVDFNLIQGKSAQWGTKPAGWYASETIRNWLFAAIPVLAFAIVGLKHRWDLGVAAILAWAAVAVVAHKEYRFLFPFVVLVIVLSAIGVARLLAWIPEISRRRGTGDSKWLLPVAALVLCALVYVGSWGLASRYGKDEVGTLFWIYDREVLVAYSELSQQDICEVVLVAENPGDDSWSWTGGYAYLHHDIAVNAVKDLPPEAELEDAVVYKIGQSADAIRYVVGYRCEPAT